MTAALLTAGCGIRMPSPSDGAAKDGAATERSAAGHGLAVALQNIGDTAAQTGDHATAAKFYRRAHEVAPQQVDPLIRLANALQSMQAYAEAADTFRQALALDADNAVARQGLGRSETALASQPGAPVPAIGGPGPAPPTSQVPAPTRLTPPAEAPRAPSAQAVPGQPVERTPMVLASLAPARAPGAADDGNFQTDPYVARIGAYRTAELAAQAREEILRTGRDVFAGIRLDVDATETAQGPMYWLRTPKFASYDGAADFCDALARRALPCVVASLVAPTEPADDGAAGAVAIDNGTADLPEAPAPAAAADAPPVETNAATHGAGSYQVQLAAYRTHEMAVKAGARFARALPDLAKAEFDVTVVDFGPPRGIFHRLRVAALTDRIDAKALCDRVVGRGYECMVVSAEPAPPPAETEAAAPAAPVAIAAAPADEAQ